MALRRALHRMTLLYNFEASLHVPLELDALLQLIPEKVRLTLECQAVHVWLFDNDVLTVVSSAGVDSSVSTGMQQAPGTGYVVDMAETGVSLRITDPADPRLQGRHREGSPPIFTAMLVPLIQDDAEIGVLEAVNPISGEPFRHEEEELFHTLSKDRQRCPGACWS
ncbi:GAF domain-containing protein [Granulicella sibirica]|uniref:GAF domain-containing protein n=1 Tax=Granulicella sibirica TaxID=2479048 RepID=UPI00137575C9|nr:GAF domain-containing protein [Granulicella sibirica]